MSEHDLEYGANPPGAQHEHTDIDPAIGYRFALWLSVAMLISVGIVYGTFWFFEGQARGASEAAQKYPLAVGQVKEPPLPNLQKQPFKDIFQLRQAEAAQLGSYGVVDREAGVVHIPIDRAMELMLQRGFPARVGGGDGKNVVTEDSSSGRTMVPR
ncbi:MAG: hypothetical protein A3F69_06365 [Acidobacteria bacterium RIFCSPLOWO2_12_FULL_66_10]|nr:MAG: hypothetical protein A3F69_06365 [Acidobacteria bacterium RIFCSPLOWO2_12_FULL_66_10]